MPPEVEVARATALRVLEEPAQHREPVLGLGRRRGEPREHLGQRGADRAARVEAEQLARALVDGLDVAAATDQEDAVRGRVEDLRQAHPLRLRLLVDLRVLERGRELVGVRRQEADDGVREELRGFVVEQQHAEGAPLLPEDRQRGDGLHPMGEVLGVDHVASLLHVANEQGLPRLADVGGDAAPARV